MTTRKRVKRQMAQKGTDPGFKPTKLTPRSKNQYEYIRLIKENDITFCTGPAGTGKTHVAIGMAVKMVRYEILDRIIITQPLVSVGKDMGYLPGNIMDKVGPYVTPCFDELNYYLSLSMISSWLHDKKIEVVPLSMMRGRTFNNAFVILDEAQNSTHNELKMLLTRIGQPSKFVLAGDIKQSDLPDSEKGAFSQALDRLTNIQGIGHIHLTESDIVRHHLIGKIIRRLW